MVQRRTLEDVMLAADVQTIIQNLTDPDKKEFSNHIYHLMTNDYHDRYYIIASSFVAMKIYQKFQFVQDFNLVSFLQGTDRFGETASLRGKLFENFSHQVLKSGQLRIKRLRNMEHESFILRTSSCMIKNREREERKEKATELKKLHALPKLKSFGRHFFFFFFFFFFFPDSPFFGFFHPV